jgi:hypothetical protein
MIQSLSTKKLENAEIIEINQNDDIIKVEMRVVFLSIHDINTLNEKYTAEVYVEARWPLENEFDVIQDEFKSLPLNWIPKWTPELQIVNIIQEAKSENWYRIGEDNGKLYLYEMKKIKGSFYEKLELHYYPFDVQNLTLSFMSNQCTSKCILIKHASKPNRVLTDNFRDSQEWLLYNYIGIEQDKVVDAQYSVDEGEHSIINFYCIVARKPGYFYWNAFFLIFLITVISINVFSIPLDSIGQRLQSTVTLILTAVSFKWVINRSLPPIAYLTTLDIYSIFNIFFVAILACWHAIIAYFFRISTEAQIYDNFVCSLVSFIYVACHFYFFYYHLKCHFGIRRQYALEEKEFEDWLRKYDLINRTNRIKFFF